MVLIKTCFVLVLCGFGFAEQLKIGGIFFEDDKDLQNAFKVCGEKFNFTTEIQEVPRDRNVLELSRKVCELASLGIIGVIDTIGGRASETIQSICDMLELPHVVLQHSDLCFSNASILNLYPSHMVFNTVLQNLIIQKDWTNFTILYTNSFSMNRVSTLMMMGNNTDRYTVTVRELSGNNYRDVLTNARDNGFNNFVVDCPSKYLERLLKHAQQVGLMGDEHSYIFVSPDLFTLDLDRYRYGGANITGLTLVDFLANEELWEFTGQLSFDKNPMNAENVKTKVLLLHDAFSIFFEAAKSMNLTNLPSESTGLSCDDEEPWNYGTSLLNFMKTLDVDGLTRKLVFDGVGQRIDVMFDVLELTPAGNQTIGKWDNNIFKPVPRPVVPSDIGDDNIMRNKTFIVMISTAPPYGFIKESYFELEGNERYEGFAVDLIDEIADMLGFNYVLEIENNYGKLDDVTGKWTGMVAKIREDKADFGICDFTITAERQKGIDFSLPFMSTGISILYKEPSKQPPEMFSFMAVFSNEVWYYMVFSQAGVGVVMIFVGRISHKEWQNPVPCIEDPEDLSNQFSLANSVWLIIGSVMQQGSEIAPIALAPRIITSAWWFFTMVMVASYVGTLVAFLTVEKNVMPFNTAEDLNAQKSITYGAKSVGSTWQFFQESTNPIYKEMSKKMHKAQDNDEGVERADNSTYAFFMEAAAIEYYKERHCNLMQVGGLLDTKNYGIGMKQGSKYKSYFDSALLTLKESGRIQKLKDKWWKEKRGGGRCGNKQEDEQKQLGLKNMLGAFVVLGVGSLIGFFISILDMLWGVFKRSVKYGTTFKYELIEELKFVITFSGDVKPVKRPAKSNGSFEALAEEGKDEIRSLKSIKSGRSTDSRRTQHSHSSKHSSGGLSVAFARRREFK